MRCENCGEEFQSRTSWQRSHDRQCRNQLNYRERRVAENEHAKDVLAEGNDRGTPEQREAARQFLADLLKPSVKRRA
jgi:hypothetical protein